MTIRCLILFYHMNAMRFHMPFTFFFNCICNSFLHSPRFYNGWVGIRVISHSHCRIRNVKINKTFHDNVFRKTKSNYFINTTLTSGRVASWPAKTYANIKVSLPDSEQTSPALNFSRFRYPFLGMTTLMILGGLAGLWVLPCLYGKRK